MLTSRWRPGRAFKAAQYPGHGRIGVEWFQYLGTGKSGKLMGVDHTILWSHCVWTDPVSRRSARVGSPPTAGRTTTRRLGSTKWPTPPSSENSPPRCRKGEAKIRSSCDDNGHRHPRKSEGIEHLDALFRPAAQQGPEGLQEFAAKFMGRTLRLRLSSEGIASSAELREEEAGGALVWQCQWGPLK